MARRHVLKSGLLRWARIVSRTLGIDIVFSGSQPRTDGKTIYAFALPDTIDTQTERALLGAIDHECFHVDPEDGSMIQTPRHQELNQKLEDKFGPIGPRAWNVLEDMRIETCGHRKFPGCYQYLEAVRQWMWDKAPADRKETQMENSAHSALSGLSYVRFPKLFREIILPRVSTELLMLVRYWTPFVGRSCNAADVWETYDLTVELLEDLKGMAQSGDGSQDQSGGIDSGIPGEGGSGKANAPGNTPGQDPGNTPGQDPGNTPGQGSGNSPGASGGGTPAGGSSSGGSGGKDAGSPGSQGGGGSEGGIGSPETSEAPVDGLAQFNWSEVYEDHPGLKDVTPEATPVSNQEIRRKLNNVANRVIEDGQKDHHVPDFGVGAMDSIGEGVAEDVRDRSGYRIDDCDVRIERATETTDLAQQIETEAANLYPVLNQRMRTLLLAKRANRHRSSCEDGEIDPGELYALAIPNGPRNVFTQLSRGKSIATCSILLVDGSSSMKKKKKSQIVMRCARFFSGSFEKCNVPNEVTVFQNTHSGWGRMGAVDYMVVKGFDERVREAQGRFNPMASGGTPMAEAMVEAVRRLSKRREARKLLFILTDGMPNETYGDAPGFMVRLADAAYDLYGIETIGLGVSQVTKLGKCFRDFVMLDKGSRRDVEKNFIDVLQNRVLRI